MSARPGALRGLLAAGLDAPPQRRDLCVWLGTLASWRGGLVQRLVKRYGDVDAVLGRPQAELAAFLRPDRRRDGGAESLPAGPAADPQRRRAAQPADKVAERRRYEAMLATPPDRLASRPRRRGQAVVTYLDPLYPPRLGELADPPLCLFVAAHSDEEELARRVEVLCTMPAAVVVGTRSPSPYGSEMAAVLGRDLALKGIVVVSGLAMGVDAAAQAAALRAGGTSGGLATVAVLGCGADVTYPACNASLYREVLRSGLVVSEFAWGVPARAWRFPARNRVMAALGLGVVVVEGSARSGARLTADFALDLGREVLAVPGEAGKRLTQAPHALLRAGAALCESADDVLTALFGERVDGTRTDSGSGSPVGAALPAGRSGDGGLTAVLRALERAPLSADQVAEECGVRVQEAAALLSELEIEGLALPAGAGAYRLRRV